METLSTPAVSTFSVIYPDANMKKSHQERASEVDTLERGVGPGSFLNGPDLDRRVPPYFHFPPYLPDHHRVPSLDPAMSPYFYPHLPYPFNQSLPVNSSTSEGRYQWPPTPSPLGSASNLHPPSTGGSAVPPELAALRGGYAADALTSRLQWEQYHKAAAAAAAIHYGPLALHRASGGAFNPSNLTGLPYRFSPTNPPGGYPEGLLPGSPFSPAYPPHLGAFTDQSTVANIAHLSGSLEAAMRASPHLAALGKSRKRALSHSPIEFGLDLDSLTRSSEGSLHVLSCGQASRSSSNASGSYGHLSAASLGVLGSGHNPFSHPLFRSNGSLPGSPFFNPMFYPGLLPPPPWHPGANGTSPFFNTSAMSATTPPTSTESEPAATTPSKSHSDKQDRHKEKSSSQVTSTVPSNELKTKIKIKDEELSPQSEHLSEEMKESPGSHNGGCQTQEGEVDFYETNCHWKGCSLEFETQDELVKHLNQDHISMSKKLFICQWEGCVREEKPFKAQYMLVVHMRRHTGEKPHRCTFESCNKAYSRLENLKTHLRSHTGEKPYLCEFPGCTKAFSNASDRAKHQNRTHSNAKPYMCKAPGCSKCYTDPSSLRKHVKTVHGADFYASKKHKGSDCSNNNNNNNSGNNNLDGRGHEQNGDGLVNGSSCRLVHTIDRKPDISSYNNNSNSSASSDSSSVSSRGGGRIKVENCFRDFTLTENSPASTDLAMETEFKMSPYFGSYSSCMSPDIAGLVQNCGDVSETGDYLNASLGGPSGGENEEDIVNEFMMPAASVSVGDCGVEVLRNLPCAGQRVKSKPQPRFSRNNIPTLPPLGTTRKGWSSNSRLTGVSKEGRGVALSSSGSDGRGGGGSRELTRLTRRDSNTSTLSSYMSSIRSDFSPTFSLRGSRVDTSPPYNPGHVRHHSLDNASSRSGSRQSIMHSPYEYDIAGNLPNMSPGSDSNIGALASQIEGTKLDGVPDSPGAVASAGSPCRFGSRGGGISSFLSMSRCEASYEVANPSRIASGPMDPRRASDPVRCPINTSPGMGANHQSLTDPKSEITRLQSCSMRNRRHRMSEQSIMSSRSSIATNCSQQMNPNSVGSPQHNAYYEGQFNQNSEEPILHPAFTSVDDLIIPDEMQEFLDKQKKENENLETEDKKPNSLGGEGDGKGSRSSCMYADRKPETVTQPSWNGAENMSTVDNCSRPTDGNSAANNNASNTVNVIKCENTQSVNTDSRTEQSQDTSTMQPGQHCAENNTEMQQEQWRHGDQMNRYHAGYGRQNYYTNPAQYQQYQNYWRAQRNGYPFNNPMHPGYQGHWYNNPAGRNAQMSGNVPSQGVHPGNVPSQGAHQTPGNVPSEIVQPGCVPNSRIQHQQNPAANREAVQVPHISQSQHLLQSGYSNEFENTASLGRHQTGNRPMYPPEMFRNNPYNGYYAQGQGVNRTGNMSPPLNPWTQHYHMQSRSLQRHQRRPPGGQMMNPYMQCPTEGSGLTLQVPPTNMQMSPDCNQVSSTTDMSGARSSACNQLESALDSLCNENFLDNLASISADCERISPSALTSQSATPTRQNLGPAPNMAAASCDVRASRISGLMDTSNMIVTDMNSALSGFVDDNKYHMM